MNKRMAIADRPWIAVFTATAVLVVVGGSVANTYGFLAIHWMETLGVSRGRILLAGVLGTQLAGVLGILTGRVLAAGISERVLLAAGAAAGATAFLILAWASSLWAIFAAYLIFGSAAITLTSQLVGQSRAARTFTSPGLALSVVSLGMKGGAAFMPVIIALLLKSLEFHQALLTMAVIMAACVPLIWILVPPVRTTAATPIDKALPLDTPAPILSARQILTDPVFIGIICIALGVMAISAALYINLPFLVVELGGDVAWAAYILAAATLFSAAITPFVGMATDRIDLRLLLAVPVVLVAIVIGIVSLSPGLPLIAVAAFAMTFSNAFLFPCFPAVLRSRFGVAAFPKVLGLSQPFYFGASLGAFAGGALRDIVGSYALAFQLLSVLVLLAAGGFMIIAFSLKPRSDVLAHSDASLR